MVNDDSLTSRLMGDMPPELLSFIKRWVTDFIKFDLLRYFYEHPTITESAETIAQTIAHEVEPIETALQEMADDGLLFVSTVEGVRVYSLTKDSQARALVKQFVEACEDAEFRTKVIFHIIRGMR